MQPLLYLCHRIPYPPNKGDKIRSYNILKYLSKYYHIHLGAFVDDPDDFKYQNKLTQFCTTTKLLPLDPRIGKVKSLTGFLKGTALGLPYYYNSKMQNWIDQTLYEHQIGSVLVFSSTMAQYVAGDRYKELHRCIDFIDIDSDKWAQYKNQASTAMKFIYGYEARKLFEWEKQISQEFDHSFFVSEKESDLFKEMVPAASSRVSFFNNGVDTEYFSPNHSFESPYPNSIKPIVFTGAMDYWANVDAVVWFTNKILPKLCAEVPDATFYIVGSKPGEKVKALAALPNVEVTGRVEDVRPYLAHSAVAVAPMRIARGVQNKVLEAMAMGLTAVTSTQGFEGINATPGEEVLVVDEVDTWIESLRELLSASTKKNIGTKARKLVIDQYSWPGSLKKLQDHLDTTAQKNHE